MRSIMKHLIKKLSLIAILCSLNTGQASASATTDEQAFKFFFANAKILGPAALTTIAAFIFGSEHRFVRAFAKKAAEPSDAASSAAGSAESAAANSSRNSNGNSSNSFSQVKRKATGESGTGGEVARPRTTSSSGGGGSGGSGDSGGSGGSSSASLPLTAVENRLFELVKNRNSKELQKLLQEHPEILNGRPTKNGEPPLVIALEKQYSKFNGQRLEKKPDNTTAKILIQYMNPDAINQKIRGYGGGTALHAAVLHDDYELVRLLLAKGADKSLFVKNCFDQTPLDLMTVHLNWTALTALLQHAKAKQLFPVSNWSTFPPLIAFFTIYYKNVPHYQSHDINHHDDIYRAKAVKFFKKLLTDLPQEAINSKNEFGNTLLHHLLVRYVYKKEELITALLQRKPDVHIRDKKNNTPLDLAIEGGLDISVIAELLKNGALGTYSRDCWWECTPLVSLLTQGEQEDFFSEKQRTFKYTNKILKYFTPESINTRNEKGDTLLSFILSNPEQNEYNHGLMKHLLNDHNADPNIPDTNGETALHKAARMYEDEEDDDNPGFYPNDYVEILLQYNADPNIQDKNGKTPLHVAVQECNDSAIEFLVAADAKRNITDCNGNTPLHILVEMHKKGVHPQQTIVSDYTFEQLLKNNFYEHYLNIKNNAGDTPLHIACKKTGEEFDYNLVRLLLNGSDITIPDNDGNTALHIACENRNISLARLLMTCAKKEAALTIKNHSGELPLIAFLHIENILKKLSTDINKDLSQKDRDAIQKDRDAIQKDRDAIQKDRDTMIELMITHKVLWTEAIQNSITKDTELKNLLFQLAFLNYSNQLPDLKKISDKHGIKPDAALKQIDNCFQVVVAECFKKNLDITAFPGYAELFKHLAILEDATRTRFYTILCWHMLANKLFDTTIPADDTDEESHSDNEMDQNDRIQATVPDWMMNLKNKTAFLLTKNEILENIKQDKQLELIDGSLEYFVRWLDTATIQSNPTILLIRLIGECKSIDQLDKLCDTWIEKNIVVQNGTLALRKPATLEFLEENVHQPFKALVKQRKHLLNKADYKNNPPVKAQGNKLKQKLWPLLDLYNKEKAKLNNSSASSSNGSSGGGAQ